MDVRYRGTTAGQPDRVRRDPPVQALRSDAERELAVEETGQVLGEWQSRELRVARGFVECRGLSTEQLEDIYQETVLALLRRPYRSEEHLRNALRTGIKHRALNVHRDERRRGEILAHHAPELHLLAHALDAENGPELAVLARQDRSVVSEFLTELSAVEQRVFWLLAEGMQYRAIAPVLGIETTVARNASRACERKRERFQLLYDTGRLCGFRASTILALQSGQATSEELARRAFAHLEGCAHCRAEHKTNAKRLRRSFQGQAAALLPLPALVGHLGWLARLGVRARTLQHRVLGEVVPAGQGGVRDRAAALLFGGGIGAKVTAGVVTVAVIAGGTIGATHVLDHPSAHRREHASRPAAQMPRASSRPVSLLRAPAPPQTGVRSHRIRHVAGRPRRPSPGRALSSTDRRGVQREPGGFAYLGVPTASAPSGATGLAHTARGSGGAFSP